MNRRGFALAAGFLFLSATVLFIVNVHLFQMNWQAESMSRSTVMDNLYYQRVDRVQAFWGVAKRVFEAEGARTMSGATTNFTRAIKSWGSQIGLQYKNSTIEEKRYDISSFNGSEGHYESEELVKFKLKPDISLTGVIEAAGHTENFTITAEKTVLVTSNCSTPGGDQAIICARKT